MANCRREEARGPVGAGGSRPLLGRASASSVGGSTRGGAKPEPKAPSYRVPGASVAARSAQQLGAEGKGDAAAGSGQAGKTGAAAAAAQGVVDAASEGKGLGARGSGTDDVDGGDGFQLVRARGWRKRRVAEQDMDTGGAACAGGDAGGPATSGAAAETEDADDDEVDDEGGPPTPGALHRAWLDEVAVVRRLKQQGLAAEHPAMRAAVEAREAAEREWRLAKDPTPSAVKLARAEAKLERALELQGEAHKDLTDYQAAHEEKLAALQARLGEARERVSLRRSQLEEVQDEVGAGGQEGRARVAQGEAARKVHATLCSTVAPTIASLVEQLESSSPAWSMLNGLLGTLSDSQSLLEKAFSPPGAAQRFDIAKGEGGGDEEASEWSESHDLAARGGERRPAAGGEGGAAGVRRSPGAGLGAEAQDGSGDHDLSMGTGEWWDSPSAEWAPGARWEACGYGKWARASWAEEWEQEQEGGGPAAARRRLEPTPPAPAIASDAAGSGSPADVQRRKTQHDERVQRIVMAAIDAGVQPITQSGQELQMLDPPALDAWVAEHLPEEGMSR